MTGTPDDDVTGRARPPRTRREAREQAARAAAAGAAAPKSRATAPAERPRPAERESRRSAEARRTTAGEARQPAAARRRTSTPVSAAADSRSASLLADDDETSEFVAVRPEDEDWGELSGWASEEVDESLKGASYEEVKRHHRRRAGRSCLALIVVMVVVLAGIGYGLSRVGRIALPGLSQTNNDYTGNGTGTVHIDVKEGDTGTSIAQTLVKAGVVKSAGAFVTAAGASRDFGNIQPGDYTLRHKMSASAAVSMMLDPKNYSSTGITIPEGLWASQIFGLLSKRTGVPVADYQKVSAASLGLPASANGHLEGYLFPSTYNFAKGTSAQQQLKAMTSEWTKKVGTLHIPANKLHNVMVVASLVEAESRLPADGPKVARVIDNRVAKSMPLQLDSTIHYAEQKRGKITTTDAERNKKGPYNSYLNAGLPPTPIANPGLSAIKAALHPAKGSWLYFVTVNPQTGKTLFATSYADQQKNEQVFHSWCTKHPGKC